MDKNLEGFGAITMVGGSYYFSPLFIFFYNLADCVEKYDKHESETLKSLAESMGNGKSVENAQILVEAATYA